MSNFKDLTGSIFGKLTITGLSHMQKGISYWVCVCECEKAIITSRESLRNGKKSCGCDNQKPLIESKFYFTYQNMIRRCYEVKNKKYQRYGGRGITVCDEWKDNPREFIAWCEVTNPEGSTEFLSLDRIDNDGPYSPNNCRWATRREQFDNTEKAKFLDSAPEGMAWCSSHKEFASVETFGPDKRSRNGYRSECNPCRKEKNRIKTELFKDYEAGKIDIVL